MKVLAVSTGKVRDIALLPGADPKSPPASIPSGIWKSPVSTPDNPIAVAVDWLGLANDEIADLSVHGGPYRAVYAYPHEHYGVWQTLRMQAQLGQEKLPFGALGENLTIEGIVESSAWIGDVLRVGEPGRGAVFRITVPREPCLKFNARMGFKQAAKMMVQSGYTGFYLEVLEIGTVRAGDPITLVAGERRVRVDEQHRILTGPA